MRLHERHVQGVCLAGQGVDACKYLGFQGEQPVCMKLGPEFKGDRTRAEKLSASGRLEAQGDNCDGVLH